MNQTQEESSLLAKVKELSSKRGEILVQRAELRQQRDALKHTNIELFQKGLELVVTNVVLHHERVKLAKAVLMDFMPAAQVMAKQA